MRERNESYDRYPTGPDDVGRRLDRVARKFLSEQPLGAVFGAIRRGDIRVNGAKVEGAYRIRHGDSVEIRSGLSTAPRRVTAGLPPAWFHEAIVLENENILAMDKPAGLLTHGPRSLQTLVRDYLLPKSGPSLSFAPGPLHRLDRNTSGLVLFGKSTSGASRFTALLRSRSMQKRYLALLEGEISRTTTWTDRLERDSGRRTTRRSSEGREVQCIVRPLCTSGSATLVSIIMKSGFTHQIRAQAALHSHRLIEDAKYGAVRGTGGFVLHAGAIMLPYFDTVLGFRSLEAPLPAAVRRRLDSLFGASVVASALKEGG